MRNIIKSKFDIFKQRTYIIIYGTSTFAGKMFDILLLFFILISVGLAMMESVEEINMKHHIFLIILEWIITFFFTIEYILRIITNKKRWQYIFSFYGIIDLLALLPMYVSLIVVESKFLLIIRVLRLLRVFRILDLVSFSDQANELWTAIQASRTKIFVFIYFVLVLSILLGALMYVVEPHNKSFTSVPRSVYWCIVTLTTVGYGDVVPTSVVGQIVASVIMILGYGVIAVPTGIITTEYGKIRKRQEEYFDKKDSLVCSSCKICSHCSNTQHLANAKYCQKCGNPL